MYNGRDRQLSAHEAVPGYVCSTSLTTPMWTWTQDVVLVHYLFVAEVSPVELVVCLRWQSRQTSKETCNIIFLVMYSVHAVMFSLVMFAVPISLSWGENAEWYYWVGVLSACWCSLLCNRCARQLLAHDAVPDYSCYTNYNIPLWIWFRE